MKPNSKTLKAALVGLLVANKATARLGTPYFFDYAELAEMKAPYRTEEECAALSLYLKPSLEKNQKKQEAPQKAVYYATKDCNATLVFEDQAEHSLLHSTDKRASTKRSHVHILGNEKSLGCVSKKIRSKAKLPISHRETVRQSKDKCMTKSSSYEL